MSSKTQLALFLAAVTFMGAALGVHESIFNNFLKETFDLAANARGELEFPRELPGLLVVLMTGILCTLAVTRVGAVGSLVFAAGMAGLALWGSPYSTMILMMMIGSAGMHLLQPVGASITLGLSDAGNRGRRMGLTGAIGGVGVVLGAGLVGLLFDDSAPRYPTWFLCSAGIALLAAATYSLMHISHLHQPRARLVFRKKYMLYYVLEFLFGARKQIFITFGFWVLIEVYQAPTSGIGKLLMTAAVIGVGFRPLAGWAIDRLGERTVMMADGLLLAGVCIGYGYAPQLVGDLETARVIACVCFIADNLLFALGTGRAVYVSRLAETPQDLNSTLAMGISINHIASMTLPAVAGIIWMTMGYEKVFAAAAVLALILSAVSSLVPRKGAILLD